MSHFERIWSGSQDLRVRSSTTVAPDLDDPVVPAFRVWTVKLMSEADQHPTPRSIDLRKLKLTEGYREALRQAPRAHPALFGIWDEAYRVLEHLSWELAPPVIDPPPAPPPPDFDEIRRRYKEMKRKRGRDAEERSVYWHPLEITDRPADRPSGAGHE